MPFVTTGSPSRFDALDRRIEAEIASGRVHAAQVAVGLGGEVVHARSFGGATDADRFVIFSATKALVAMAILPNLADGSLDLTTPVSRYLPEFGERGKSEVTVLQLLTMQGGFPQALIGPARWGTGAGRRAQFAEWQLEWPAGSRTEYHPVAAHWVIAELLEALNERSYLDLVHERVVAPVGVDRVLGPEAVGAVPVRVAGEYPADRADLVATFGRDDLVPVPSVGPEALLALNDPRSQAAGIPGGGAIAAASDLAAVYQGFLANQNRELPQDWLRDAIGTVRNASLNLTDHVPANRTIAGYVSGNDGYHRHRWMPAAPRAFGHAGAGGQLCWVDPDSGLSFAFLHDTLHQDPRIEFHRADELNRLVMGLRTR